jgi:hypothetical protein
MMLLPLMQSERKTSWRQHEIKIEKGGLKGIKSRRFLCVSFEINSHLQNLMTPESISLDIVSAVFLGIQPARNPSPSNTAIAFA